MEVTVVACTERPIETVSLAAGNCYGKDNVSFKRIETCAANGHTSVLEHASATFKVEGISRSCSHQLVRHRMASYSQQSQRYCRIDVDSDDWYVVPPSFAENELDEAMYRNQMLSAAQSYADALEAGIRPEDARFMLPESCKTDIFVTMNLREFAEAYRLRANKAAQWEIRELFDVMRRALESQSDDWFRIVHAVLP